MVKQTIKKFAAVLLTAGICAGLFAAPVFAAEKTTVITNAKDAKKSARYIEPEEWNQKELFAYLFDNGQEITNYILTGGIHYYLSLIHISEPTRRTPISYAVFCLKKKNNTKKKKNKIITSENYIM